MSCLEIRLKIVAIRMFCFSVWMLDRFLDEIGKLSGSTDFDKFGIVSDSNNGIFATLLDAFFEE